MKTKQQICYITYQSFPAETANSLQTISNIKYLVKNNANVKLIFPLREKNSDDSIKKIMEYYSMDEKFIIVGVKHFLPFGKIKFLEGLSRNQEQTQIFMETPYRNNQMIEDLVKICSPSTKLCLAANLNTSKSYIKTKSIEEWKSSKPNLNKVPCIFLLGI